MESMEFGVLLWLTGTDVIRYDHGVKLKFGNDMAAPLRFYPGLHQPGDAKHFDRACISINRIWRRKKPILCNDVFVDGAAFTELEKYGEYRHEVYEYGDELYRLHTCGAVNITVAVAQDYMCEPFIIQKTGFNVPTHQYLTVERYDFLLDHLTHKFGGTVPFHILPVLQGFEPEEYADHVRMYGDRLKPGMWVGVGSVCKRQGDPKAIRAVLCAIKALRPDLLLHGFGVKKTSLKDPEVRAGFYSADSMAWSTAARKQGRNQNDWREAMAFVHAIMGTV